MQTYPLSSMELQDAINLQFKIIDCITREFKGHEILNRGDLGIVPGINKPITTQKVEKVVASVFDSEAACFVRGAGTGAIRYALCSLLSPGDVLLVHKATIYNTTKNSIDMMGIRTVYADFNQPEELQEVLKKNENIKAVLIQYTRQRIDDSYDMEDVIKQVKACRDIPIITDDNYAVMKVKKIGSQCGADLSCFSSFKLLGPEGIGCIVGKKQAVDKIARMLYSGGNQTQGHESLDVLKGMVYAPVALAIQAQVNEECLKRLKLGEVKGIKNVYLANAQSKVLLVEFEEEIAKEVLKIAEELGAAPNPVGAESKYEMVPMFYRISGTFLASDPSLENRMIRINPMRAGADTVIRILQEAVERTRICS